MTTRLSPFFSIVISILISVFCSGIAQAFDESLHTKIQSWHSPSGEIVMNYGERFGGFVAPALGIFPYLAASLNQPKNLSQIEYSNKITVWRDMSRALLASTAVVWLGKVIVGRARPYVGEGAYSFQPFSFSDSNWNSFPSGHTASAFAAASVLSHWADNTFVSVFMYSSATLTAYARMYEGKHWLSDVLVGGALGYLAGRWSINRGKAKRQTALNDEFIFATPRSVGIFVRF